ncbi:MAG: hypothetical protein A2521_07115 [Deltaproteobacteria bacterium RIFOXYD12_FULL_57_12]|nr:MAG: hypothetical protein A2521_07115 [Deltaproteobacteria bacterium RIFOXYD12_FULL_57_12]
MHCGRGPADAATETKEICPAACEKKLHGVHGGNNAGRSCWIVAGTLCGNEVQGVFAKKYGNCVTCDFYHRVMAEEASSFELTMNLMKRIKPPKKK